MKFKYRFLVFTLALLTVASCSNDDDMNNDSGELAINIITGINAKQDDISGFYRLGNPNVKMPYSLGSLSIIAFPNPSTGFLSININATNIIISDIWVIPATVNKESYQNIDFEEILSENTYTINEISQLAVESFSDLGSNNQLVNLEGLATGYYRVFIKTNEGLYWDNIYLDNGGGMEINELFEFWGYE